MGKRRGMVARRKRTGTAPSAIVYLNLRDERRGGGREKRDGGQEEEEGYSALCNCIPELER